MKLFTSLACVTTLSCGMLFADQATDDAVMLPGATIVFRTDSQKLENSAFIKAIEKINEKFIASDLCPAEIKEELREILNSTSSKNMMNKIIKEYPALTKYKDLRILNYAISAILDSATVATLQQQDKMPPLTANMELNKAINLAELVDIINRVIQEKNKSEEFADKLGIKLEMVDKTAVLSYKPESEAPYEEVLFLSCIKNNKVLVMATSKDALTGALERVASNKPATAQKLITNQVKKSSEKPGFLAIVIPQGLQEMAGVGLPIKLFNALVFDCNCTDKFSARLAVKYNTVAEATEVATFLNSMKQMFIPRFKLLLELNSSLSVAAAKDIFNFVDSLSVKTKENNAYITTNITSDLYEAFLRGFVVQTMMDKDDAEEMDEELDGELGEEIEVK